MPKSGKENNMVYNVSKAQKDRPSQRSLGDGLRENESKKRKNRKKKRHHRP